MWLKKDLPDGRQVQRIFIPKGFDWVKTISPMLSKAGEGPVMWCPAVHKSDLHAIDDSARWRGDARSSPLDGASAATSSPRNDRPRDVDGTAAMSSAPN